MADNAENDGCQGEHSPGSNPACIHAPRRQSHAERMLEIQAEYEHAEAADPDSDATCGQGIHGRYQRTPNGLCPWCEWERAEIVVASLIVKYEALAVNESARYCRAEDVVADLRRTSPGQRADS